MRDDRLTDMNVSGEIRLSKTVPLPSGRLIPREHWAGVAVQCRYTLHVGLRDGRIVVTDVDMDDMVMLVQKPRRPLTGKPDYESDGEMMSAVFTAGRKRENTTRNWLDDDDIDMCRHIAEQHKPTVEGALTLATTAFERIALGDVRPFSPAVLRSGEYETPKRIPLKVLEESAELVEASKAWLKSDDDPEARRAMLDEMADVLQTVANQCAAFHIGENELRDAMIRCEERNRRRGRMGGA